MDTSRLLAHEVQDCGLRLRRRLQQRCKALGPRISSFVRAGRRNAIARTGVRIVTMQSFRSARATTDELQPLAWLRSRALGVGLAGCRPHARRASLRRKRVNLYNGRSSRHLKFTRRSRTLSTGLVNCRNRPARHEPAAPTARQHTSLADNVLGLLSDAWTGSRAPSGDRCRGLWYTRRQDGRKTVESPAPPRVHKSGASETSTCQWNAELHLPYRWEIQHSRC